MRTGVILLQMGGPRDLAEVRPFLYRLLSDPAIVPLPAGLRHGVALLASAFRAGPSRRMYAAIGGGSPLGRISRLQADRLGERLRDADVPVYLGLRYTAPSIADAVREAAGRGIERLVAVPLYPHFCRATTGSAFTELRRAVARLAPRMQVEFVRDYADDPGYLRALAETVTTALDRVSPSGRLACRVLFSAHGLPKRQVLAGDPYPDRIAATVAGIAALGDERLGEVRVCFQSRVGPAEWIGPSTDSALREAAADRCAAVVLVPVSFVSDHLETLYEVDHEYCELARKLGIREFIRAPALNESGAFVGALEAIVRERL
jgi:ferrochelatase